MIYGDMSDKDALTVAIFCAVVLVGMAIRFEFTNRWEESKRRGARLQEEIFAEAKRLADQSPPTQWIYVVDRASQEDKP